MGASAKDCPICVEVGIGVFLVVDVVVCMSFPQTLAKGGVFLVCVVSAFLGIFLSIGVCVE